jgi:hypothetical protein
MCCFAWDMFGIICVDRWASESKKITPASAFRHLSSYSVRNQTKKCRTVSLYFGTGQVPASLIFFSPVPDWPDAGRTGIPIYQLTDNIVVSWCYQRSTWFYIYIVPVTFFWSVKDNLLLGSAAIHVTITITITVTILYVISAHHCKCTINTNNISSFKNW